MPLNRNQCKLQKSTTIHNYKQSEVSTNISYYGLKETKNNKLKILNLEIKTRIDI